MPRIINAFQGTSPVASSLSKLGIALFGDAVTGDLKRAQLEALQRQEGDTRALQHNTFELGGFDKAATDPATQAAMIGAEYDPEKYFKGARGAAYATGNPIAEKFSLGAGDAASSLPSSFASDQARQERQHAATLGETRRHNIAGEDLDQNKFAFDKTKFYEEPKPALVNGQPVFRPQGRLTEPGVAPILSETDRKGTLLDGQFQYLTPEEQREVLGADPEVGTTRVLRTKANGNYLVTDESLSKGLDSRGNPLPPPAKDDIIGNIEDSGGGVLTNAVTTDVQSDIIGGNAFLSQADAMIKLADEHPESFGIIGAGRNALQEMNQTWRVLAQHLGFSPDLVAKQAAAQGWDVAQYDRSLPQVKMLSTALTYSAASAIAGQENRSVSDTDRKVWQDAMGNAQSFFSLDTAEGIKERSLFAKAIVKEHQRLAIGALEQGYKFNPDGSNSLLQQAVANVMANPNSFTAGPSQAVPGFSVSPTPPPEGTTQRIKIDVNGNIIQ